MSPAGYYSYNIFKIIKKKNVVLFFVTDFYFGYSIIKIAYLVQE